MDNFKTEITGFAQDIVDILQAIAPLTAMIGIVFAAILYFGANIPGIDKLKKNNPDLTSNIMMGMFLLFIASGVVSLIQF